MTMADDDHTPGNIEKAAYNVKENHNSFHPGKLLQATTGPNCNIEAQVSEYLFCTHNIIARLTYVLKLPVLYKTALPLILQPVDLSMQQRK